MAPIYLKWWNYFLATVKDQLELPFLPATQAELPANPLDTVNTHNNAVIGQIPM